MVWVLWDILIPLLASFALGTLLGWLVWSWRRRNHPVSVPSTTAEFAVDTVNSGVVDSDVSRSVAFESDSMVAHVQGNAEIKEMEKANVVLITERDEATQAFESMQIEVQEMRDRIAELETDAEESVREDSSTDASEVTAGVAINSLPLTAGLDINNKDKQELDLLRSDLKQLTDTLERERKARRATELELLNIKNRHDKLSSDFASTVSVVEHNNQIGEREEEIEFLKEQLLNQSQQQDEDAVADEPIALVDAEVDVADEAAIEVAIDVASETEIEIESPVDETDETLESTEAASVVETESDTSISVAEAAGIDFPELKTQVEVEVEVEAEAPLIKNKKPIKNGHVPEGWDVPDDKPSKKERDQLTDIKGVGPVMEKILHDCGIYYYRQVANLDKSGIDELQLQIPQFPGRIQRDKWVKQAKVLQQKKYGESA